MNLKNACAVILGTAFLVVFVSLAVPSSMAWPAVPPVYAGVGAALWKDRTYEALLQGMVILAGVLSVLLLLGLKHEGGSPP